MRKTRSDGQRPFPAILLGLIALPMGCYAVSPAKLIDVSTNSMSAATSAPILSDPHLNVVAPRGARFTDVEVFRSAEPGFLVDVAGYDQVTLTLTDWPREEFIYILEGNVEITDSQGNKRAYGPNEALVMPKGFNGTWTQLSRVKKIAVCHTPPAAAVSNASHVGRKAIRLEIVPIASSILNRMKNRMKMLESWEPYLVVQKSKPARFLEVPLYTSKDRQFKVEVERFEAVDIDLHEWPIDETFHLVRGHIVLDAGDGSTRNFGPGDTFVMPKGFSGHWHQPDTVDLITVDYDASGAS